MNRLRNDQAIDLLETVDYVPSHADSTVSVSVSIPRAPSPERGESRPETPSFDGDESLLAEHLLRRRHDDDDLSIETGTERLPARPNMVQSPASVEDVLRSVGIESSYSRPRLSFPKVGDAAFGFQLQSELGRGAFARVFLAKETELGGRAVAVKISAIEGSEPKTLAQMQHPHIVPIYSVREDVRTGLRVVCMPYYGGASLADVAAAMWARHPVPTTGNQLVEALERIQSRPPREVAGEDFFVQTPSHFGSWNPLEVMRKESYSRTIIWIAARLAEGLQHAHQRKVLHRDIKPANVLIGSDGQPMLLDFNLAQDQTANASRAVLGGTIAYMSPEHLRAMARRLPSLTSQVDHRADIYSLGMVLHEMLIGTRAFEKSGSRSIMPLQIEAMAAVRSKAPPSLRATRPDLSWGIDSIVRTCLEPNPEDRYQQAEDLAEDLRRLFDHRPLKFAREHSLVEQAVKWTRRNPRTTALSIVFSVAFTALVAVSPALARVRGQMADQHTRIKLAETADHKRQFDEGVIRSLCLVNTTDGSREQLLKGASSCESTLAIYGLDTPGAPVEPAAWAALPAGKRLEVAEDTRELLLLLAFTRVELAPGDRNAAATALELIRRAESIGGLEPSRALSLEKARYLQLTGETDEAVRTRESAARMPVVTARDHYLLALALVQSADHQGAVKLLDQAIELEPRNYWILIQRGICQTELGLKFNDRKKLDDARDDFLLCGTIWPDYPLSYFNLGCVKGLLGDADGAMKAYQQALKRDPEFAIARLNIGQLFNSMNRPKEALEQLDQARTLGLDDARVNAARALALEATGRHDEADAAFDIALEKITSLRKQEQLKLRSEHAFSISTRDGDKARQIFELNLVVDPRHADSSYGLAMLAANENKDTEAVRMLDRVIQVNPVHIQGRRARAVLRARVDPKGSAFEEDIAHCQSVGEAEDWYVRACVRSLTAFGDPGRRTDAIDSLSRAIAAGVDPRRAARDPDLLAIRNDPRFPKNEK